MTSILPITTPGLKPGQDINKAIFDMVSKRRCSFIEATLDICEILEVEPSAISKLVNKQIKERLRMEYESRHMIREDKKKYTGQTLDPFMESDSE